MHLPNLYEHLFLTAYIEMTFQIYNEKIWKQINADYSKILMIEENEYAEIFLKIYLPQT